MNNMLDTAVAKIRSIGDRTCENQVYYFDDYDPEEDNLGALCARLGIPETDEIVIEYPAKRTFDPLSRPEIAAFEKAVGASLPKDYKQLLETFGPFHLPGNASICLASPSTAISYTCGAWHFDEPTTMPVLAISPYHQDCDGDSMGFMREGDTFASPLYRFKHDLRWEGDDPAIWSERIADSFAAFIIAYIDNLS